MNDDMLNAVVGGAEETRIADCRNADNHDLGAYKKFPIGDVPEVNGLWAQEVEDFVPTTGELLVIAEHWASVAIERTYVGWANANFWGAPSSVRPIIIPLWKNGSEEEGSEFYAFSPDVLYGRCDLGNCALPGSI